MTVPALNVTGWGWGGLGLLGAFLYGLVTTRVGTASLLRGFRRSAGSHWTERARQSYPVRAFARWQVLFGTIPPIAAMAFRVAPGAGLWVRAWSIGAGLAAFAGVYLASRRAERAVLSEAEPAARSGPGIYALIVLPVLMTLALSFAMMPLRWGWPAAAVMAVATVLITFHAVAGWVRVMGFFGRARAGSPRLMALVDRAAGGVGVRPRSVIEVDCYHANAVAWPLSQMVVFTRPLVERLTDDELVSIAAHELGHLAEPRGVLAGRLLVTYGAVGLLATIPLATTYGLVAGLAPAALFLLLGLILRRVGRRMEERADALGQQNEGGSAGTYARALESLYRLNFAPAVDRAKRQVHPHLYDRLLAAGVTPEYPRPEPPPVSRLALVASTAMAFVVFVWSFAGLRVTEEESQAWRLSEQARGAFTRGDMPGAANLYQEAERLDPAEPLYPANRATVLVRLGRLDEAEAAVRRAEWLADSRPGRRPLLKPLSESLRISISLRRVRSKGGQWVPAPESSTASPP